MDYPMDTKTLLTNSGNKTNPINESSVSLNNVQAIRHWAKPTRDELLSRGNAPELPLKRLSRLNRKIWGIHKGWMTVIGGRTSQGKSVIASNIAWDLAEQKKRVYFISLEMTVPRIIERMFCAEHSIDNYDLLTGKMATSTQMCTKWDDFEKKLAGMPLIMSDMIGRNWQEVEHVIERLGTKPEVVIIDHLQEISARGMKKLDAITEYLRHMRELSIKNKFALIVCSQINRLSQQDKDLRPKLHHLKDAGAIEEMADLVFLAHWPHHYNENEDKYKLEINIAKNRNGMTGYINVKFIPEYSRLEDYEQSPESTKIDGRARASGEYSEESNLLSTDIQQGNGSENNSDEIKPEDIVWEE